MKNDGIVAIHLPPSRSTAFDFLYQPGAEHYADFNVHFRTWFDMYQQVDVPF